MEWEMQEIYHVIPAQAGIQLIKKFPRSMQHQGLARFAERLSRWIPACAGMTVGVSRIM
jgi:hypothetical protein